MKIDEMTNKTALDNEKILDHRLSGRKEALTSVINANPPLLRSLFRAMPTEYSTRAKGSKMTISNAPCVCVSSIYTVELYLRMMWNLEVIVLRKE